MRGRDAAASRTVVRTVSRDTPPGPYVVACGKWWRRQVNDFDKAVKKARRAVDRGEANNCVIFSLKTGKACADVSMARGRQ